MPSTPGYVPKYESNDRFSCMITTTWSILWLPVADFDPTPHEVATIATPSTAAMTAPARTPAMSIPSRRPLEHECGATVPSNAVGPSAPDDTDGASVATPRHVAW